MLLEAHAKLLAALGSGHAFVKEAATSLADHYERADAAERAQRRRAAEPAAPSPSR